MEKRTVKKNMVKKPVSSNKKANTKKTSVKLGVYLSIVVSLLIIVVVSLFAIRVTLCVGELAAKYEQDIANYRGLLVRVIAQSMITDNKKKDFSTTRSVVKLLRNEDVLSYIAIENENGVIFKVDEPVRISKEDLTKPISQLTQTIGDYTITLGVKQLKNSESFYNEFYNTIPKILFVFLLTGIIIAIFVASSIAKQLVKLSKAVKVISGGNFNVKLENTNFEEINDLIYSYNEMIFQLNELYQSLELKVQERTIALETANYKLKETQAMMVHSEKMRSLGELVAGIAHEINNPVNFIHGNIMILQNYADDLFGLIDLYEANSNVFPEEIKAKIAALRKQIDVDFLRDDIKELIRSCIEGTERTKNIVLDLKNFSRMEEMVISQIDIPKEIDTTLNILNNKYKNRIQVIKNYAPDVPKIEAYGGQLNQVFMNILDNAQDAMAETGTLTINLEKVYDKVKLEFIDTGKGIPEENLKKVFDPFFTTKPVGKGTGLGMSISYRVINDHKGTIEVESEVGKGTKFTVILPINQSSTSDSKEDSLLAE